MKHFVALLTVLLFFIWLLPLGFFIKPAQEKMACDGQRAMCMCSFHIVKKISNSPGKMMIVSVTQGTSKEAPSSGGVGNYFVSHAPVTPVINGCVSQWEAPLHFLSLPIIQFVEHVPRF